MKLKCLYLAEREGSTSEHTLLILSHLINPRNIDTPKSTPEFSGLPDYQSDPRFDIPTGAFRARSGPVVSGPRFSLERTVITRIRGVETSIRTPHSGRFILRRSAL
jgi:hypothetical protein